VPTDGVAGFARQRPGRDVERLLDPSGDLAVARVDELMAEANSGFVESDWSAEDVKAGAGAQFAGEPDINATAAGSAYSV
jgi:hypothetical protein